MESQGRIIITTPEELSALILSAVREAGAERAETNDGADSKKLLTPKDIQRVFGIHQKMLAYWRLEGIGPAYVTFGRRVFYERPVFEDFVQSGRIQTTGYVDR